MSTIDEVLRANDSYAQNFTLGHLPLPPARKLAIVACMDARLMVDQMLGLKTAMPTLSVMPVVLSLKMPCDHSFFRITCSERWSL
jgi:hypothetical protein